MEDLNGKVAVITGSTSGIGRASAIKLARRGVKMTIHGMNEERGRQVVGEIQAFGGKAIFVQQNLAHPEAAAKIIQQSTEHWGALDILVNNAALICNKPMEEVNHEDWDSLFAVNVKAGFFMIQEALPWLKRSGSGTVINVSSINRLVNSHNNLVYDAMKAALNHMTRGLSLDLRSSNIRVNAVMPGGTATPLLDSWLKKINLDQIEIERIKEESNSLASPEQIAEVIVFLASSRSAWINGAEIPVDGGFFIGK